VGVDGVTGGTSGYVEFLAAIADPRHEEQQNCNSERGFHHEARSSTGIRRRRWSQEILPWGPGSARLFFDFLGLALQTGFRLGRDCFGLGSRLRPDRRRWFRSTFSFHDAYRHPVRKGDFASLVRQRNSRILESPLDVPDDGRFHLQPAVSTAIEPEINT
jgi:hypothetical protein